MFGKDSASDKTILTKVNQRLARAGLGSGSRVTATVRGGQVTLSGNIQYEMQRRPTLRAADGVDGIRGIVDQLQVRSRDTNRW